MEVGGHGRLANGACASAARSAHGWSARHCQRVGCRGGRGTSRVPWHAQAVPQAGNLRRREGGRRIEGWHGLSSRGRPQRRAGLRGVNVCALCALYVGERGIGQEQHSRSLFTLLRSRLRAQGTVQGCIEPRGAWGTGRTVAGYKGIRGHEEQGTWGTRQGMSLA